MVTARPNNNYAAGVPVLHFFTGAHEDYHKPTDDVSGINAAGGARIAELVANLALKLSRGDELTYRQVEAPPPRGDVRGYGASLGTIPDYTRAPDDQPGMVLAGVVAGGLSSMLSIGDLVVPKQVRREERLYAVDGLFLRRPAPKTSTRRHEASHDG